MARKTVIISDLSGKEGAEEVSFSWDGQAYTIDLLEVEKDKVAELLAPYLEKASRVKAETIKAMPKKRSDAPDPRAVREWAAENDITVNAKGRVPKDIIEKYLAAQ
ncbi:histone-like nucleoid-structuring protein Lsr2 [Streptomyces caniscabiei]|uniref:histone-like nucleoid-structuring protein Lsr2 n=1 Tax=Streptomyces caniscabiei TaxID=2746961 RepID=UPI0029A20537|nr:Lsr2 family protein [Streptomyces caniscabiei]MDX2736401.1 Lsr2 family protein [Streptomyces caniscabiei]